MHLATQNTLSPRWMEALPAAAEDRREQRIPRNRGSASWAGAAPAVVGARFPLIAESLGAALQLERGQRVLELGAGSGHIALSAGRRGCQVSAIVGTAPSNYMEALLERDKHIAEAENMAVDFWRWDLAELPFANAEFDAVATSFAAMFEPEHEQMAAEMLRLCRPGGRIGIASWTYDSFVGQLYRTIGEHLGAGPDAGTPFAWGTAEHLQTLFADAAESIEFADRTHVFRHESVQQCIDSWSSTFGPLREALATLDARDREDLLRAVRDLVTRSNTAADGHVALRGDYLEVVVEKRREPEQGYTH